MTCPDPGAAETAERLNALGFTPASASVMSIATRPFQVDRMPQAVLVTSGNAISSLPATLKALPLLAVGDATATRARIAGFQHVRSAAGDAAALAEMTIAGLDPASGPLLLASGAGQGMALAATLRSRGFKVWRRVAYAARPAERLPDAAQSALAAERCGRRCSFLHTPRAPS